MSGMAWIISWYKHSADKSASRKKGAVGNADMAGGGCMKSNPVTVLGLTLLAGFLAAAPARAEDAGRRVARSRPIC